MEKEETALQWKTCTAVPLTNRWRNLLLSNLKNELVNRIKSNICSFGCLYRGWGVI